MGGARHRRPLPLDLDPLRGPALHEAAAGAAAPRGGGAQGQGVTPPIGDKTLPTPDPSQVQVIRSYGPGHFTIGQREWRQALLVTPPSTTAWSPARAE